MIHTHAFQDGGVQVVDVHRVLHDVVAEVVGFAVGDTALDAAARHPHTEIPRMVVATVVGPGEPTLGIYGPTKLTAPDDQCVFEQATGLEIMDECRGGLVDVLALGPDLGGQVAVLVPAPVQNLHTPHTALDQPPGQQRAGREGSRLFHVVAV